MCNSYFSIGQRATTVEWGPAGEIFISQWGHNGEDDTDRIEFDPIFVPTLIDWLREMVASKAVG